MQLSFLLSIAFAILCLPFTIRGNLDANSQIVVHDNVRELKKGYFLCEVFSPTTSFPTFCLKKKQLCDTSTGKARCICEEGWKGSRCQDRIYESPSILPTRMPTFSSVGGVCTLSSDCAKANSYCVEGQCQCQSGFTARKDSCININECNESFTNGCDKNADCIDNNGGYQCSCKDGFSDAYPSLPGRKCQQTNECELGTHICDEATQVCVDRRPPEKWECVEKTPSPTPKPSRKPIQSPACNVGAGQCECVFTSAQSALAGVFCRMIGNSYSYIVPGPYCSALGGVC